MATVRRKSAAASSGRCWAWRRKARQTRSCAFSIGSPVPWRRAAAAWRKARADCSDNTRLDLHPAAGYHTGRRDDAGAGQNAHGATAR